MVKYLNYHHLHIFNSFDDFTNENTITPGFGEAFFKSYKIIFIAKIFIPKTKEGNPLELDFDALRLALKEIGLQHYANTRYPNCIMKIDGWFIAYSKVQKIHLVGFIMKKMKKSIMKIEHTKTYKYDETQQKI
jgi:hypothetical protein